MALAVKPSVSSCIYDENGKELRGVRGQHVFGVVQNAGDIPEIGQIIADRLWLAGYGYMAVAANGNLLERTIADTSVWQPERLVFGRADCGDGLNQRFPEPYYSPGGADDILEQEGWITPNLIAPLTENEREEVILLKSNAKAGKEPEARAKREEWVRNRARERAKHEGEENNQEVISRYAELFRKAAEDGDTLPPDLLLYPQVGRPVTVKEILADTKKWESKRFADPIKVSGDVFTRRAPPIAGATE